MFTIGEKIRYLEPLDHDYTYGVITAIKPGRAEVMNESGYHKGKIVEVAYSSIEHRGRKRKRGKR